LVASFFFCAKALLHLLVIPYFCTSIRHIKPIGGNKMLNEKDSSYELDAYEEDKCPSMALDANDKADDNPCSRNQKPASAAIGGALGGIGGRCANKPRSK